MSQDNKKNKGEEHTVAVCGGGGVGKSSCTIQFIKHFFDDDYDPTIEDSYTQRFSVDKQVVELNVIDTAGQDEFKSLRPSYMRPAEGFIFVFDMTSEASLETLEEYVTEIQRVKDCTEFPIVLLANKSDLTEHHAPGIIEKAEKFKKEHLFNCPMFQTSAKLRVNIEPAFGEIVRILRKKKAAEAKATEQTQQPRRRSLFASLSTSQDTKSDLAQFVNTQK